MGKRKFITKKPIEEKIRHGTSVREDGPMGVLRTNDDVFIHNQKRFALIGMGIEPAKTVTANLLNENKAVIVSESHSGTIVPDSDGLITQTPNLALRILTQDCVPVFIYDEKKTTIGLIHCGWRGIKTGITENTLEQIRRLKIKMTDLKIVMGPSIKQCCYEVDGEAADFFSTYYRSCIEKKGEKARLSLQKVIKEQLTLSGVLAENIHINSDCTFCAKDVFGNYKYFSWRRDGKTGNTHASVIIIFRY